MLLPSDAIINVSMKPVIRDIPPGGAEGIWSLCRRPTINDSRPRVAGHVARWMWQGPGRVQLNASCMDLTGMAWWFPTIRKIVIG